VDEAMDAIVARSRTLLDDHGASAFGFYTTSPLFLEEYDTLAVIGPAGVGTKSRAQSPRHDC
jgi:ferredoxin-nitrate reductase